MSDTETWYIVRQENGQCAILPANQIESGQIESGQEGAASKSEQWGPYASQSEAIARRVGLIRAGKCQPA
jgi:hypothetical protein